MAFEQLVAEAAIKKEKEKENKKRGRDKKDKAHDRISGHSSRADHAAAADAPNVPKHPSS